jgi:hypothetical protein
MADTKKKMAAFLQRDGIIVGAAIAIGMFLSLWGIDTGLPTSAQTALAFPERGKLVEMAPVMKATRDEVYAHYRTIGGNDLRKTFEQKPEMVTVTLDGEAQKIDKRKVHALRSALMHTRYPDEAKTWAGLSNIRPDKLQFNTHLYHYGGLYIYSAGAAVKFADMLSLFHLSGDANYYFLNTADIKRMYLAGRLWGTLVALLAIPAIYLVTRRMYGRVAGLLAAVFMAVIPAFSVENHYMKPYAFSLPFILGTLYFALRAEKDVRRMDFALAGLFAGLGTGALLLNGVFILCPMTALAIAAYHGRVSAVSWLKTAVAILAGFAVGFIISNPHWFMAPAEAVSELTSQAEGVPFVFSLPHLVHHFLVEFPKQFTLPVYLLVIGGAALALRRRTAGDIIMFSAFVPYYVYIGNQFWLVSHYALPLIPFAVIMAAGFCAWGIKRARWRNAAGAAVVLSMLFAFGNSLYYDVLVHQWHRAHLEAGNWINTNIEHGSTIGATVYPYFGYRGYPAFDMLAYCVNESSDPRYYITVNNDDAVLREAGFGQAYREVRSFNPQPWRALGVYRNDLYYMWEQNIRIFERRDGAMEG